MAPQPPILGGAACLERGGCACSRSPAEARAPPSIGGLGGPSPAFDYNTRILCAVTRMKVRVMMVAVPARQRFADVVETEEELRALLGQPSELVIRKQLPQLDEHCRAFIALSPFLLLG